MIISTCASRSPAFKMQAVSWLVMAGSGPWLYGGIQPSAIAQGGFPIVTVFASKVSAFSLLAHYCAATLSRYTKNSQTKLQNALIVITAPRSSSRLAAPTGFTLLLGKNPVWDLRSGTYSWSKIN